jgi:hypothetical protein
MIASRPAFAVLVPSAIIKFEGYSLIPGQYVKSFTNSRAIGESRLTRKAPFSNWVENHENRDLPGCIHEPVASAQAF